MNQVFKKVYENYKKANAEAKKRMVISYGFKNEADFLSFIGAHPASNPNPPVPTPTTRKKKQKIIVGAPPIMHNVYILDASGSMAGGKIKNAIEGINEEIKVLKANPDADYTTQSIVDFSYSHDIQTRMWKDPVKAAGQFYASTRGSTALLEAVGKTITKLLGEHKDGEKVLVKIFTDGEENASGLEWKGQALPNLIKEAEDKGFVVTFVGTSSDVAFAVANLNLKQSNTLVHDNTASGVKASFKKSIGATVSYRAAASRGVDTQENFFIDPND